MDERVGWIESLNQGVRGIVTLGLGSCFCYGFLVDKISGEVFTAVFTGIVGFWFGNRDRKDTLVPPMLMPTVAVTNEGTTITAAGGNKP